MICRVSQAGMVIGNAAPSHSQEGCSASKMFKRRYRKQSSPESSDMTNWDGGGLSSQQLPYELLAYNRGKELGVMGQARWHTRTPP